MLLINLTNFPAALLTSKYQIQEKFSFFFRKSETNLLKSYMFLLYRFTELSGPSLECVINIKMSSAKIFPIRPQGKCLMSDKALWHHKKGWLVSVWDVWLQIFIEKFTTRFKIIYYHILEKCLRLHCIQKNSFSVFLCW